MGANERKKSQRRAPLTSFSSSNENCPAARTHRLHQLLYIATQPPQQSPNNQLDWHDPTLPPSELWTEDGIDDGGPEEFEGVRISTEGEYADLRVGELGAQEKRDGTEGEADGDTLEEVWEVSMRGRSSGKQERSCAKDWPVVKDGVGWPEGAEEVREMRKKDETRRVSKVVCIESSDLNVQSAMRSVSAFLSLTVKVPPSPSSSSRFSFPFSCSSGRSASPSSSNSISSCSSLPRGLRFNIVVADESSAVEAAEASARAAAVAEEGDDAVGG